MCVCVRKAKLGVFAACREEARPYAGTTQVTEEAVELHSLEGSVCAQYQCVSLQVYFQNGKAAE